MSVPIVTVYSRENLSYVHIVVRGLGGEILNNGEKAEEIDMRKAKSKEKGEFFNSHILKIIGLCIIILGILSALYVITLCFHEDATGILDVIKVLVGVTIGGAISATISKQQ